MRFVKILVCLFCCFLFTQCKKEVQNLDCLNENRRNELVQTMQSLSKDTTQITAAERQFYNEIRTIANDIDVLSNSIDTSVSIQQYYNQIRTNFLQHAALVEQKANLFYQGNIAKIILAKNAFVLMSYDALQRKYPEFMWTQLGIFAANEVRSGLVLALEMRYQFNKNNIHIPIDGNGTDIADAMLLSSQILIQGQINVLTDIGSLGILNRKIGAARIKNETWLTTEAKDGFRKQELAEQALKSGDCRKFMDLQTAAAIQFGAHEQIYILQPMWDKPMMQQFSNLNKLLMQLTNKQLIFFGDIFVGTNKIKEAKKGFIIKLPASITDLSNANQRVTVAINGFNTINSLRKIASWNEWLAYSQIKIGYFNDVYLPNVPL